MMKVKDLNNNYKEVESCTFLSTADIDYKIKENSRNFIRSDVVMKDISDCVEKVERLLDKCNRATPEFLGHYETWDDVPEHIDLKEIKHYYIIVDSISGFPNDPEAFGKYKLFYEGELPYDKNSWNLDISFSKNFGTFET